MIKQPPIVKLPELGDVALETSIINGIIMYRGTNYPRAFLLSFKPESERRYARIPSIVTMTLILLDEIVRGPIELRGLSERDVAKLVAHCRLWAKTGVFPE